MIGASQSRFVVARPSLKASTIAASRKIIIEPRSIKKCVRSNWSIIGVRSMALTKITACGVTTVNPVLAYSYLHEINCQGFADIYFVSTDCKDGVHLLCEHVLATTGVPTGLGYLGSPRLVSMTQTSMWMVGPTRGTSLSTSLKLVLKS